MALAADVANLVVALRLDDKGFSGKLNAAAKQLNAMDRGLSQMGRGAGQVAGGLGRLATVGAAAAAGGLAAVVTTAASFEQAFTGVEKTVEGTDAQLAELEETLRGMARTMPVSFEELAGIGEAGGALGIARESLDEFIDVVARLAVSTDLTAETAATALGQLGNVLHLSGQEFEDFADTLVALGNAGASTESQIVDMAARFGAAGNAAGLSKEEILALSSAVASMGIEAEAGGSSLSRIFNQTTTNIGTGSAKAKAFAKALGLTFDEFTKAWDRDALGTFQDLLDHLNDLDKFQAAALLKKIGVTGVRDINAIGLMAQNVGFVADQLEIAQSAQGALGTESGKFFATTQSQWKILTNNVRDAAAVLGKDLLPVVNEVMGDFVGFLAEPGTQKGLASFAKDLAAGVKGLAAELKDTDFSGIIGGIKLAADVAKGAFDAFRALPEPIQQLAIAALIANKVSGGAIGQIAAGLGNLLLGSLKTITAANVTVIGGTVTGVGGGAAGKAGGGLAGGLKTAGALAAIPLAGTAGVMLVDFVGDAARQADELNTKMGTLPRDTGVEISASIDKIDQALAAANGSLLSTIVTSVSNTQSHLETQRAILVGELQKVQAGSANASSIASAWSSKQQAAYAALNATQKSQLTASTNASSVASSWSARHSAAYAAMNAKNSALVDLSRSSAGYNARTASASETSRSTLAAIRAKRSSVTVNVTSNTSVSLSAAQMALRIISVKTTQTGIQHIDEILT